MVNPTQALPPCPFCNGPANYHHHGTGVSGHGESGDEVKIKCSACGAQISRGHYAGVEVEERKRTVLSAWEARVTQKNAAPEFDRIAQLKLDDLKARGYSITGYAIEKPVEGGQPSRGFINAGGFVGWWADNTPQAVAAQAPAAVAVPDGWKLVPVEPTHDMLAQASLRLQQNTFPAETELEFQADAHTAWDAMLSTTPALPATEPAPAAMSVSDLQSKLLAAANYIDALGGDSKSYRAALAATPALSATESVLIEGVAYTIPEPVALELLRLNIELQQAEVQAEPVASGKYLPLPMQYACSGYFPVYSSDQMRAYADAHRNTAPQAQPADAPIAYLQEADQHLLHRFIETTEDDESFDIGKDAVKRLANLGVVENCGFGRYGVTMFGYWVHEHFWHQNPSLPLKTYADRDRERHAAMAAAQEGNAANGKDGA